MQREIIPGTQWPEGRITGDKIATGKGYFKCTNLPMHQVAEIMNYPIEESIGYPTPGSFGTWGGIERSILTITRELDD